MDVNFFWLLCGVFAERQNKLNLCDLGKAFNNFYARITESIGCQERKVLFLLRSSQISLQSFFFQKDFFLFFSFLFVD